MPPKTNVDVDRNLLFAVIALQDDLIDQTQFADVCAGWAVRIERSLSELLIERGWLTKQDREDVERKLERKLKKHRGDVHATLGAVAEIEARDVLQVINDPRLRQSLDRSCAGPWARPGRNARAAGGAARFAAVHAHPAAR